MARRASAVQRVAMAVATPAVFVREARADELPAGVRLLAGTLGFRPEDAIPAWLAQTTTRYGGLAIAAIADRALAGFSYALPAVDGDGPFLFSCGLAVTPAHRGAGVGLALKASQGRRALERGYRLIRWTADPLNAPALRLYLTRLGARGVAYHPGLHDAVRPAGLLPQDDLEIEWDVTRPSPGECEPAAEVEIPWDLPALLRADAVAAVEWRLRVRAQASALLGRGYAATGVRIDRSGRRAFLGFGPP
jgi:predicted GNAT superfamily acetyltransferase